MPPVMGAGAFVMAALLGVSYSVIILAALVPALLYFLSLVLMVYFEARRSGIEVLPADQVPAVGSIIRERGYLLIPIAVLVICLVFLRYSATTSGLFRLVSLVAVAFVAGLVRERRLPVRETLDGLRNGILVAIPVALACATAGIVIGVVAQTGLGVRFTQMIVELSNDSLWLAAVLTMVACIVLGMGLPTTAAYIITAILGAPALVALGVPLIAAHVFIFYFAIVSFITPPVALSSYAASGIAGSGPFETSLVAFRLGLAGFLVPHAFIHSPEILLLGGVADILLAATTAMAGIVALSAALVGWLAVPLAIASRLALFVSAIAMISPSLPFAALGLATLTAIAVHGRVSLRRTRKAA